MLLFHHAPSPILVIDLSVLLFHQAPSPLLAIALPGRVGPGGGGNETQNQTHLSLGLEVARQCQHAGKAIVCRRPHNPEYLGKCLGKFIQFLREIVLAPKAPMMHELALMTSSTLSNLAHRLVSVAVPSSTLSNLIQ